jgi:uncharacterized Zn-binding protein involved in type VI secretion
MGMPAAKRGDKVVAFDTHFITTQSGVTLPVPMHPFNGILDGDLSGDVRIEGQSAATVGTTATNTPRHLPLGGLFAKQPSNKGEIIRGSARVFINGKAAARAGDTAKTCNDPVDLPVGTVIATSKVLIGD